MLLRTILKDEVRFLTFRSPSTAILKYPTAYLAFGLLATWAAGIGRYWDSPSATFWQHAGLTSIAYALVFSLALWLLAAPLGPKNWTYRNVLLFVTLTSPPALLYAIPVELWMPASALAINSMFLGVVAAWRLALLFVFLRRVAALSPPGAAITTLLPLVLIVDLIFYMGIGDAVYATMAGLQDPDQAGAAFRQPLVQWICSLSMALTPLLVALYIWMTHSRSALTAHTDVHRAGDAIMSDIHLACSRRPKRYP
jgi:hypothetical protein